MDIVLRAKALAAMPALLILATACGGGGGARFAPMTSEAPANRSVAFGEDGASVLKMLKKQVVIGSTSDPKFKQGNPYGLSIAPSTAGAFTAGDLAVCNFNAKSNVQGTGYTLIALHPKAGSTPTLVSSNKVLLGCAAIALGPGNYTWAASFVANANPILGPTGKLVQNITGKPLDHPFGQIYAPTKNAPAFYESNAGNGTIVRFNLNNNTADVIAKGFAVNHGKPGSIFGPSGLAYDLKSDTLYIVDGTNNTVVAFSKVSTMKAGAVTVGKSGTTFTGPSASLARKVFAGAPLNGPISSALLFNGNLAIGNTSEPSGTNDIVEISKTGKLLDVVNVDKGAAGAIFGMVATGTTAANTKLYFNDDNGNNVQVLER